MRAEPRPAPSLKTHDHHRLVKAFDQLGGHDPHHTLVPAFGPQDQSGIVGELLGGADGLVPHAILDLLALAIHVVQLAGQASRGALVGGQQKIQGNLGIAKTTRGVHAGGQSVADVAGHDRASLDTCQLGQGAQTGAAEGRELAQTNGGQNAVLVAQRHHVRNRAHGHEVQDLSWLEAIGDGKAQSAQPRPQGSGQVEGHPAGGQSFERELVVRTVRVEQGVGRRWPFGNVVVVDDDDIHPAAATELDGFAVAGPAIPGHNQGATLVTELGRISGGQAIAR